MEIHGASQGVISVVTALWLSPDAISLENSGVL